MMKKETKEFMLVMWTLWFVIFGIIGGVGIALSLVEGIENAIVSIPFWILSSICLFVACWYKKNIENLEEG